MSSLDGVGSNWHTPTLQAAPSSKFGQSMIDAIKKHVGECLFIHARAVSYHIQHDVPLFGSDSRLCPLHQLVTPKGNLSFCSSDDHTTQHKKAK